MILTVALILKVRAFSTATKTPNTDNIQKRQNCQSTWRSISWRRNSRARSAYKWRLAKVKGIPSPPAVAATKLPSQLCALKVSSGMIWNEKANRVLSTSGESNTDRTIKIAPNRIRNSQGLSRPTLRRNKLEKHVRRKKAKQGERMLVEVKQRDCHGQVTGFVEFTSNSESLMRWWMKSGPWNRCLL